MKWILLATGFLLFLSGSGTVMAAEATLGARVVIVRPGDPIEMKIRANVIGEVCDMERNPESPECLMLIEPSAGYETVEVDIENGETLDME